MLGEICHLGELLTRNARFGGSALGLCGGGERYSWRQGLGRALRLASSLQARGLCPGERVALLGANSVSLAEGFLALPFAGLGVVPVNARLTVDEVAFVLQDAGAVAILAGDEHLELARDAAGRAPSVRFVGGLGEAPRASSSPSRSVPAYSELLAAGEESTSSLPPPADLDDPYLLLYTSGTTGFPKAVVYSHRSALAATLVHVLAIGSHRRHRVMLPSPLASAAGFAGLACAVAVGSETHVLRYSAEAALATLARERITFTNLVPTTLKLLLEHPTFVDHDLSALEVLLYGGSPMPEATLRQAAARLACGFRQTFATSETGLAGTVLEPEDHRVALTERPELLLSCGRPQVGVGVQLVGEDGFEVAPGNVGEVAIACAGNMVGYWNRPEETARVQRGGWVRTGDLARWDEAGYLYLLDRKGDLIVSGAYNVAPSEVERVLAAHPDVADCAVIGVPDERWGEVVKAFVVRRSETLVTEEELLGFASERLADFKRPRSVDFVAEVPRNPAGKTLRRVLREPYWRGQSRGIA